ncbi:MAG: hypothetical protein ACFWT6_00010 [Virgibacillus proomii]|jgi:hypothetical protein
MRCMAREGSLWLEASTYNNDLPPWSPAMEGKYIAAYHLR